MELTSGDNARGKQSPALGPLGPSLASPDGLVGQWVGTTAVLIGELAGHWLYAEAAVLSGLFGGDQPGWALDL